MATFSATAAVVIARPPPRGQLLVARAETFRCAYSKKGLKACSAMDLSPAVLKGMGVRWSWRPCGRELVEERVGTEEEEEDTRPGRSSSAWRPQLRAARAETAMCGYSKENRKALAALDLSPAVLEGMGLRWSWRPWGPELVEERMDTGGRGHEESPAVGEGSDSLNPE